MRRLASWVKDKFGRAFTIFKWFLIDHNGKPSTTRLLMWMWTFYSIRWIEMEMQQTGVISGNAVFLVVISLLGPTTSLLLKKAPVTEATNLISTIITTTKK